MVSYLQATSSALEHTKVLTKTELYAEQAEVVYIINNLLLAKQHMIQGFHSIDKVK